MQNDNDLHIAFRRRAEKVTPPASLDARAARLFDSWANGNKRNNGRLKSAFGKRVAIVALSISLFSGVAYASTALYVTKTNNLRYEMNVDPSIQLKHTTGTEIYKALDRVRGSLGEDEKAVAFVRLLDREKLPAMISLSNPRLYTDLAEWKKKAGFDSAWKIPTMLPEGFTIAGGRTQLPTEGVTSEWIDRYGRALQKEAGKSGESVAWVKVEKEPLPSFSGVYAPNLVLKTKTGEEVTVSWMTIPEGTNVIMDVKAGGGTAAEKLQVNGSDAVYTYSPNHFFSETGQMQMLMWAESAGGSTIKVELTTESSSVSKEDLLAIASHMN